MLRLVPSDRPLFFCDNCCSANFYVPICLWCKWTSAAARKSFEEKAPRGRTMSTPKSCSVGLGRTTKGGLKGGVLPEKIVPRGSLDTDRSTEPPETPRSLFRADNSPAIAAMEEWVNISEDEIPLVGRIDSPKPLRKPDLTFPCDSSPPPSRLPIHITRDKCVTRGNTHQLLMTTVTLSSLSTDLCMPLGVTMGYTDFNPSPTMNRKGIVVPPTPGTAERKAKVTSPDPQVTLLEREGLWSSRHRHPPPSTAAHYIITSEAGHPLPNRLLIAEWFLKSHPSDTSLPTRVQTTSFGNPKHLLHPLSSQASQRRFHLSRHSRETVSH